MNNTFLFPLISGLTGAALAIAMAATQPAHSAPVLQIDAAHQELVNSIERTGIDVKVNPGACARRSADGWYWAARRELVICQDNAVEVGAEVAWTSNELDPLRHEAQDLIQDCMDRRSDGRIKNVYRNPDALVQDVLTETQIRRITESYTGQGRASAVPTELEAFSVAALNDPGEQVRDIYRYCLGN